MIPRLLIISVIIGCLAPSPALFASDAATGILARTEAIPAPVVCFPEPAAKNLLRAVKKDLPDCQAGAARADETIEAQENRIEELRDERDRCAEASKEAAKAGEAAVKAASPSWFQRAKSAGGWMGLGAIMAIVAIILL